MIRTQPHALRSMTCFWMEPKAVLYVPRSLLGVSHSGGRYSETGSGWLLQGVPRQNNPAMVDAHEAALRASHGRGEAPSFSFTLSERFSPNRADVSWVRSAYLAAFSALGWRYILRPALDPIRKQLRNPDTATLPALIGFNADSATSARRMMLVEVPEELSSVFVIIGRYSIFLPDPWGTSSCDELAERLANLWDENGRLQQEYRGTFVPWPAKPMYLLDKAIRTG